MTRRVVTGHDEAGASTFICDGPSPWGVSFEADPGFHVSMLWSKDDQNISADAQFKDVGSGRTHGCARPGGSRALLVTFPPDSVFTSDSFDATAAHREQMEKLPGLAEKFEARNSGMHVTPTLDYGVVLRILTGPILSPACSTSPMPQCTPRSAADALPLSSAPCERVRSRSRKTPIDEVLDRQQIALRYLHAARSRVVPGLPLVDRHCPVRAVGTIPREHFSFARRLGGVRRHVAAAGSMRSYPRDRCLMGGLGNVSRKAGAATTHSRRRHGTDRDSAAGSLAYYWLPLDVRHMRGGLPVGSILLA